MMWTRTPRRPRRHGCRPVVDGLESRRLLTLSPAAEVAAPLPVPAGNMAPATTLTNAFDAMIGATAARRAAGLDGSGMAVAVVDTGVNYRHDALGDGFGAGRKVLDGYDFGDNDADPDATSWQHGTAVAGVIAGTGAESTGIAPGAGIVALRVFGDDNQGGYDKIADALQWVIDRHEQDGITVVNLSLSDGNNYTGDSFPFDGGMARRLKDLIAQLKALNIPVVTAAGNSFGGEQGMGYTAIMRDTISVTATDAQDRLLPNAQRLGPQAGALATDLAAPGSGLTAPGEGEGYVNVEGTSFAAPVVSGAIVLLQSIYKARFGALPTVDQVEDWLTRGADTIHDATTGIDLPRLNIARSAALIPFAAAPEPPAPVPEPPAPEPAPGPGAPGGGSESPGPAPAPSPAPEGPPPVLIEVYRNGESVGSVEAGSAGDPLREAFGAFGLGGSLTRIDSWSASGGAPESPAPAGAVVRIPGANRAGGRPRDELGATAAEVGAFRGRMARLFGRGREARALARGRGDR